MRAKGREMLKHMRMQMGRPPPIMQAEDAEA